MLAAVLSSIVQMLSVIRSESRGRQDAGALSADYLVVKFGG